MSLLPPAVPAPDGITEYITVYRAMFGWKGVLVWWNPEGFYEPFTTSPSQYPDELKASAILEARAWALAEDLPFKEPTP